MITKKHYRFGDLGVDDMTILKRILKKVGWDEATGYTQLRIGKSGGLL
jgi:hypothetical protein